MSESLTNQWKVTKQAVRGKGVVVAQNWKAAQVGAEILRKGGNAIDAAVALIAEHASELAAVVIEPLVQLALVREKFDADGYTDDPDIVAAVAAKLAAVVEALQRRDNADDAPAWAPVTLTGEGFVLHAAPDTPEWV